MQKQLMKYNPAFLSQEELVRSFVVRQADLDFLVGVIRDNTGSSSNQHVLITGPRGMGKTTLVLRAAAEIRSDSMLSEHWYPLVFSEESYEVMSPGEFWLEALFHIGIQTGDLSWQTAYEEIRKEKDESRVRDRALARLMDFADQLGKRIVLIVENLQMLFGDQMSDSDAWDLRHTLINERRLMLLATATSRFEEIEGSDKAMHELFRVHELRPLDNDECRVFWTAVAGEELRGQRVKPIRILTGGNPRLLSIIATFAAKSSFSELMADLTKLVDDHTDYFKSHLEYLAAQERKVYVALADLWDPASAREVADAARLPVSQVSSLLLRLASKGAVVSTDGNKTRKRYQVAERLYNIYHLMRRRGGPSHRVQAVVNFMVHFYIDDELVRVMRGIAEEAITLAPSSRSDHNMAFVEMLKHITDVQYKKSAVESAPRQFIECPDIVSSLRELYPGLSLERVCAPSREPEFISEIARHIENGDVRTLLDAAAGDSCQLVKLGAELSSVDGGYPHAEKAYRQAIEGKPDCMRAWALLGQLLQENSERYAEAEQAYRKAAELSPDSAWVWGHLGVLLYEKLGRSPEAEAACRKAVELDPDFAWGWGYWGMFLHEKTNRYAEAEAAYRRAQELEPCEAFAWVMLGSLLQDKLGRYSEAEQAYKKAIELCPTDARVFADLARLLLNDPERYPEAEEAYNRAIDLQPDSPWIWGQLGVFLQFLGRYPEAETAYRKALEFDPTVELVWEMLGSLLHGSKRYTEAEAAYRKALELRPDREQMWSRLIGLYLHELDSPSEAWQIAGSALQHTDRSAVMLNDLAWTAYTREWPRGLEEAETWAREAVDKEPEEKALWHTLASVLGHNGKWDEALEVISRLFTDAGWAKANVRDITDLCVAAATGGQAANILSQIESSSCAGALEPLIYGLRMFLEMPVSVAQEIKEVAEDIVQRIRARQEKLDS